MLITNGTAICQGKLIKLERAKKRADLLFTGTSYAFGPVHHVVQDYRKLRQSERISRAAAACKELRRKASIDRGVGYPFGVAGLNYRHDSPRLVAKADGSKFLCKPMLHRRSSLIDAQGSPPKPLPATGGEPCPGLRFPDLA